jgi:mRNA-degrading endonuclease toxin of MazEF toxin-antitoxin module
MKPGDIVLTVIPQDDQQKRRPVLILKTLPKYGDFLVCAVSSQFSSLRGLPYFRIAEVDSSVPIAIGTTETQATK